jgi:hypothetical protein
MMQLGYGGKKFQLPVEMSPKSPNVMSQNMMQSTRGTQFGSQSNGGIPNEEY